VSIKDIQKVPEGYTTEVSLFSKRSILGQAGRFLGWWVDFMAGEYLSQFPCFPCPGCQVNPDAATILMKNSPG
jgi:hypothetical protein